MNLLYKLTNADKIIIFVLVMESTSYQTQLYANAGRATCQYNRTARIPVEFGGRK